MPNEKESKPRSAVGVVKVLVPVIAVLVTTLITFVKVVYRNHMIEPKLKCDISSPTQDRYFESASYRSMKLVARPQILVRYKNCVVISVYLAEYYQNEYIFFTDGIGIACKADKERVDALRAYIKEEILTSLAQSHSKVSTQEIDANLFVYISILGGVTYTNERGSYDKMFCITEEDGSILDYNTKEKVISHRLREYDIKLPANPSDMKQDDKIKTLIQSSAEYIGTHCLDSAVKHIRIPQYTVRCFIVVVMLLIAYEIYSWHRKIKVKAKKLLQKLCSMDWPQQLALTVVALVIMVPSALGTAHAATITRDERLTYAELDITEQKSTGILFAPEQPKATDKADEPGDLEPTVSERLHILNEFLGVGISDYMLEYYGDLFSGIYWDGAEEAPTEAVLPSWFHLKSEPYTDLPQRMQNIIVAEEYKCSYSKRPANLYHLGRVLTDTVLIDTEFGRPTLDFESLLHIAADGVACGESFLTYADHSIGENKENLRNAEDIALRNGKVYWALANALETVDDFEAYRDYAACLWVAGFKCMEQGREQAIVEDPEYAIMTYYLGNFSERMLPYIIHQKEEDCLYSTTGKAALAYYEEARELLEQGRNTYNSENFMSVNIQSGINTLNGLGFYSTTN